MNGGFRCNRCLLFGDENVTAVRMNTVATRWLTIKHSTIYAKFHERRLRDVDIEILKKLHIITNQARNKNLFF